MNSKDKKIRNPRYAQKNMDLAGMFHKQKATSKKMKYKMPLALIAN